jgi:hypothetical protein
VTIEFADDLKTPEQLARDHLVRITLERAALRIERQAGNDVYIRAWKAAAKIIREMKPG